MPTNADDTVVAPQALIDAVVAKLTELVDEQKYAQSLAASITKPIETEYDAAVQAAFRDPRLINRSVIAADFLMARANNDIKRREGEGAKALQHRTIYYKDRVGRERNILKSILRGEKAKRGILDVAPNPRARAMERLVSINMRADIPKGLFAQLVAEEEEKVRAAKRKAKQEAKERAKAAKAAARAEAESSSTDARANSPRRGATTRAFTDQDVSDARARQGGNARTPNRQGARTFR